MCAENARKFFKTQLVYVGCSLYVCKSRTICHRVSRDLQLKGGMRCQREGEERISMRILYVEGTRTDTPFGARERF